jgi:hypothetical protein
MIPRLRFTRAYHTTAKRYMRHLNARPPCIFDVVQSGSIAKAAAQLRVKQALGIGSKPAGYPANDLRRCVHRMRCRGVRALARHGTLDIIEPTGEGGQPCRLSDHREGHLSKQWALSPP